MRSIKKIIRKIVFFTLLIVSLVVGYISYDGYNLYKDSITKTPLSDMVEIIEQGDGYLTYDEIPTLFVNAIIAVEDHRFYEHNGFDIISFSRAMVKNVEDKNLSQGGSTITQQLAKNMYFSFEKKFSRKVAELLVAIDLEKNYDKKKIISLYINSVYFGDGYYGLNAASHGYFNKDVSELTDDEITLLAGIPNAPSAYALSQHKDLARKRQKIVIECLKNYGDSLNEEK